MLGWPTHLEPLASIDVWPHEDRAVTDEEEDEQQKQKRPSNDEGDDPPKVLTPEWRDGRTSDSPRQSVPQPRFVLDLITLDLTNMLKRNILILRPGNTKMPQVIKLSIYKFIYIIYLFIYLSILLLFIQSISISISILLSINFIINQLSISINIIYSINININININIIIYLFIYQFIKLSIFC